MREIELVTKIANNYPKVWGKLCTYLFDYKLNNDFSLWVCEEGENYKYFKIVNHNLPDIDDFRIPFIMLYGLLEDFFKDNGIILTIEYSFGTEDNYWSYTITGDHWNNTINQVSDLLDYKNEAKEQAILKACEILESRI